MTIIYKKRLCEQVLEFKHNANVVGLEIEKILFTRFELTQLQRELPTLNRIDATNKIYNIPFEVVE